MAHDYAKRPRNGRRKKSSRVSSGPVWLLTGVFCGLFLAFLLQLAGFSLVPGSAIPDQLPTARSTDSALTSPEQQQPQAKKRPRFEFYSLLPEAEVEVLEEAEVPEVESSFSAPLDRPIQPSQGEAAKAKLAPPGDGKLYVLQAGSFKRETDADRLRARLLLMGLDVNVERVKLSAFDSRHRVLVGPYGSRREAAQARNQLTGAKVETLVLERKAP